MLFTLHPESCAPPSPIFPNDTDQQLLSVAANNAATAFHNACLINELRSVEEALRSNEKKLMRAHEKLEISFM